MTLKKNIGYIGLGNIGGPTAKHIINDEFNLYVYDLNEDAVKTLTDEGASACRTIGELASTCEHIGLCVRDDTDINNILYGTEGILENANKGTLIAISSTISHASLAQWEADVIAAGMSLVDAPISGGVHGAAAGNLVYMVGCSKKDFERAKPVFETSAELVIHTGELGSGTTLKLANNLMTYAQLVAVSEAFALAEAHAVDPKLLFEISKINGVINHNTQIFISARDDLFASGGAELVKEFMAGNAGLGEKDLKCAIDSAHAVGIELPLTRLNQELIKGVFLKTTNYNNGSSNDT